MLRIFWLAAVFPLLFAARARGATPDHRLDFWLGHWVVTNAADGSPAGRNRIEATLQGAAIVEDWSGIGGDEGKSWFYFYRPENRWKRARRRKTPALP